MFQLEYSATFQQCGAFCIWLHVAFFVAFVGVNLCFVAVPVLTVDWASAGGEREGAAAAAASACWEKERPTQRNTRQAASREGSMAGLQDFHQGSHCHRKTWINILLGILQLLLPCVQHGGAQLQGLNSPLFSASGGETLTQPLQGRGKKKEMCLKLARLLLWKARDKL